MTFRELDIDLKGKTSGLAKVICPKCSHLRKKKHDPCLSVNITEGLYKCHNCEWSGTINEKPKQMQKVDYKIPSKNITKVSDKVLDWFKGRGISQATVIRFDITESEEFMPQIGKKVNCINFNYFKDSKLVNIKYRDGAKNFKMVQGAELVFYNIDAVKDSKTIIICEGEMDCLSFYEAGIYNVISVPSGAQTSENAKLEYLNSSYEILDKCEQIILAIDHDETGLKFQEILANRLGKDKCFKLQYLHGCKDANEILLKGGVDSLRYAVENPIPFPLDGIKTVADFQDELDNLYLNGPIKVPGIGFDGFDRLIRFCLGQLTIITGVPGSGKSEFLDQILVKLSEKFEWRHGIFSAENQPEEFHAIKLIEKYTGESSMGFHKMKEDTYQLGKEFVYQHFFFIKINEENIKVDGILKKAKELITRYGIKMLVIDNWANLEHSYSGETEHQYIGKSLIKVFNFCKQYNIHVVIVAHPTKIKKVNGKYEVPTMYDISGSSHWFNKTDNGICVYRDYDTGNTTIYVQKVRHKYVGEVGSQEFEWQKNSGRYIEVGFNI